MNIFELLLLVCPFVGFCVGASVGHSHGGIVGALVGALGGTLLGVVFYWLLLFTVASLFYPISRLRGEKSSF